MDVKGLLNSFDNQELGQIIDALPSILVERGMELPTQLGGVAVEAAGSEAVTQEVAKPVDVLSLLSPEQQERATKLTAAMAEKFGVEATDFSVLATETETGEQQFTVAYTAGNGIYKGSWNKIMDKKSTKDYTVELDGQKIDTRTGMTLDVYKAMVEQARANGETLPDSRQLSDENGQGWTWTLRTGQQAGDLYAPYADVNGDGSVYDVRCYRDYVRDSVRFRPAVVL